MSAANTGTPFAESCSASSCSVRVLPFRWPPRPARAGWSSRGGSGRGRMPRAPVDEHPEVEGRGGTGVPGGDLRDLRVGERSVDRGGRGVGDGAGSGAGRGRPSVPRFPRRPHGRSRPPPPRRRDRRGRGPGGVRPRRPRPRLGGGRPRGRRRDRERTALCRSWRQPRTARRRRHPEPDGRVGASPGRRRGHEGGRTPPRARELHPHPRAHPRPCRRASGRAGTYD